MIRTRILTAAALALLCLAVPSIALTSELESESPPECTPPPGSQTSTGDPAPVPDGESGEAPSEAPPADGATDGPDAGREAPAEAAECEQPEVVPDVVPEPSPPPPVVECPPDSDMPDDEELPPDESDEEDWEEPLAEEDEFEEEDELAEEDERTEEEDSEVGDAVEEDSGDAGSDEPAMGEPAIGCEPYPPICSGPYGSAPSDEFTDPLAGQEGTRERGEELADEELAGQPPDDNADAAEPHDLEETPDALAARQLVEPVDTPREDPRLGSLAFALLGAALAFPIARVRRRRRS